MSDEVPEGHTQKRPRDVTTPARVEPDKVGTPPGVSRGPGDFTPINPNQYIFDSDRDRLRGPGVQARIDATRLKERKKD